MDYLKVFMDIDNLLEMKKITNMKLNLLLYLEKIVKVSQLVNY